MAKTGSNVRNALPKRASKVSADDFLYIINHQIRNDIMNDVYQAFYDEHKKSKTITIAVATYSYEIGTDYYDLISVKDANGNELSRVYQGDEEPVSSMTKYYWISGKNIHFPKKQIDDLVYKTGGKIYVTYLKTIAEIDSEESELPYQGLTQDLLFPVYVSGVSFFNFGRRKKVTDRALAQNDYETAKLNVFSRFV